VAGERATYKLNHFALSWDPTGQQLIGSSKHPGRDYPGARQNQLLRDLYAGSI